MNHSEISPSVIVCIGDFGECCKDMVLERQALRIETGVEPGRVYGLLEESEPAQVRFVSYQKDYAKWREDLREHVSAALRAASAHSTNTSISRLNPHIYVVGATWEDGIGELLVEAGKVCALITWAGDVKTDAIFLTGCYLEPSEADGCEQRTFHTLSGLKSLGKEVGYSRIFILDALKENGATLEAINNPLEAQSICAALIEALTLSPLEIEIDRWLLDDFAIDEQITCIGFGAAAARVPVKQIMEHARDIAVAHLVKREIVSSAPTAPDGRLAIAVPNDATRRLVEIALADIANVETRVLDEVIGTAIATSKSKSNTDITIEPRVARASTSERISIALGLRGNSTSTSRRSGVDPSIYPSFRLRNHSTDDLLIAAHFEINLRAEHVACDEAMQHFTRALDSAARNESKAAMTQPAKSVIDERCDTLIAGGQSGAGQIHAFLSELGCALRAASDNFKAARDREERNNRFARNLVSGADRANFARYVLRPLVDLRANLGSLVLRAGILAMLVYQFLWELSFRKGEIPAYAAISAPEPDAMMILLVAGLGILVLWLPSIALRFQLRILRQAEEANLRSQVGSQLLKVEGARLAELADICDRGAKRLDQVLGALSARATDVLPESLHGDSDQTLTHQYYEYYVVGDPQRFAYDLRHEIARTVLSRNQGRIMDGWPKSGRSAWSEIQSGPDILAGTVAKSIWDHVSRKTTHVADATPFRLSAEALTVPALRQDLVDRLWAGSVPAAMSRAPFTLQQRTFLIANQPKSSQVAALARRSIFGCGLVHTPDVHAIAMLRLTAGIELEHLARWGEWEIAPAKRIAPPVEPQGEVGDLSESADEATTTPISDPIVANPILASFRAIADYASAGPEGLERLPEADQQGIKLALKPLQVSARASTQGLQRVFSLLGGGDIGTAPSPSTASGPAEELKTIVAGLNTCSTVEEIIENLVEAERTTDAGPLLENLKQAREDALKLGDPRTSIIDGLEALDVSISRMDPEPASVAVPFRAKIDRELDRLGLERIAPTLSIETLFDAATPDGLRETWDWRKPVGIVLGHVYAGYRDMRIQSWLRHPLVLVNTPPPASIAPSEPCANCAKEMPTSILGATKAAARNRLYSERRLALREAAALLQAELVAICTSHPAWVARGYADFYRCLLLIGLARGIDLDLVQKWLADLRSRIEATDFELDDALAAELSTIHQAITDFTIAVDKIVEAFLMVVDEFSRVDGPEGVAYLESLSLLTDGLLAFASSESPLSPVLFVRPWVAKCDDLNAANGVRDQASLRRAVDGLRQTANSGLLPSLQMVFGRIFGLASLSDQLSEDIRSLMQRRLRVLRRYARIRSYDSNSVLAG